MEAQFLTEQLSDNGHPGDRPDTHDLHDTARGRDVRGPSGLGPRGRPRPQARAWLEAYDRDKVD